MPPRGRPTLVLLPPVASSSVAPLSSASFCGATAACRSLALSRLLLPFGAVPLSSRRILVPRVHQALLSQGRLFQHPLRSFAATSCYCSGPLQCHKERKKENRQPKGGMGGRTVHRHHIGILSVVLAVTYPWASASSYLSSQSVADSRCNPHATLEATVFLNSAFLVWLAVQERPEVPPP